MSNYNTLTKSKTKPMIEEVISEYADANIREAATDFAEYMRVNKMPLKWASTNRYKALQKKTAICWVDLNQRALSPIKWRIGIVLTNIAEYENFILNEGWQDFILEKIVHCKPCNPDRLCSGGNKLSILGKDFIGICQKIIFHKIRIEFDDPNEEVITRIKKLMELEQQTRG